MHKESLYLKSLYFNLFIIYGAVMPFSGIFLKHTLVDTTGKPAIDLLGIIFFILPLIGFWAGIIAGIVSDKINSAKHILAVSCFGGGILGMFIAQSGEAWTHDWSLDIRFVYLLTFLVFYNFFTQPINAILDADTMRFLNKHDKRKDYGQYRLMGTFGWSVSTIAIGFILMKFYKLAIVYYFSSVWFVVLGILALMGNHNPPIKNKIKIPWEHLRKDLTFQLFLIFIFLYGMVSNATFSYIGYFFDDVMKTPFQMGIIFGTWTIFEIPVMLFSNKLLKFFGNRWLIVIGLILNIARLFSFSLFTMNSPFIWKFMAALMHGPAFGLVHIGLIDFVDRQAHKNMKATYMSIANVARMSFAASLGGLLGSYVIKNFGGASLMRFSAYFNVVLIIFFITVVHGHGPNSEFEEGVAI